MNDIEILKLAATSLIRQITESFGMPFLRPIAEKMFYNLISKPKYSFFIEAITDKDGNVDIDGLSNALKEALAGYGGRLPIAGLNVSLGEEDINFIRDEFIRLKGQ